MEVLQSGSQTTIAPRRSQQWLGLLSLFAVLCTIFALIVSVSDAIHEHAQQSWPQVTATIQRCSVEPYFPLRTRSQPSGSPVWRIRCRIDYRADAGLIETSIESRTTTSGWGGDLGGMRQWVARHPSRSAMVVHYDPSDAGKAVLTETDMPYAGPRTPDNLKLLLIAAIASFVLLFFAKRAKNISSA